jgi:DNA-binding CsgD family transcriptional regulator/PAS domain-containing protein
VPATALGERDLRAVLDLVGEVGDADGLDDFRAALLHALPRAVPADFVSYNEVPLARQGEWISLVAPELPAWAYELWGRFGAQNPLVVRHAATRDGRAYRFSDVVAPEELHRLDLYQRIYRRLGIEHQIAFALPSPDTLVIGMALSRGGADFAERDRRVLDLARPHLIQAYRNAELRGRSARVLAALRDGLDDVGQAVVVLDERDRVAFVTGEAERLLGAAIGARPRVGAPLPAPLDGWVGDGAGLPLVVGTGERPLALRHLPARDGAPGVVFLEPGRPMIGASALRGLGLTPREAEVLHLIVRGRANDEIAGTLGVSPRTVHKHVEHVFRKLGVSSRVEAVATVWAAVGGEGS